ncbi:S-layer homology domain-containing protein [Paenibacillus oryzisoli]|uniref:SLH domain-containing protein n=1 Tax=Paenibacillus oryzisoli TaxID=1850517 RepID=A0A198A9F8_9BACL|nr:S-layer homology domain-containing protein [Paenibacillus oryzisoli]OAS17706.1 hypothetical protein A8708_14520 [Paenibacillus oryzisoli]
MRFTRKSIAVMMFVVLFLSVTATAWIVNAANDAWEDYAATDWYDSNYQTFTIDSEAKLAGIAKLVNSGVTDFNGKTLEISRDMSLSAHEWVPIGHESHPFKGILLGKGGQSFHLSGLNIDSNDKHVGFIGYMNGATVGGFQLTGDIKVSANDFVYAGAVAGYMDLNSTILNITNNVSLIVTTTKDAYVGGIVGDGAGTLSNVVNNASVRLNGSAKGVIGGIAATSHGAAGLTLKKIANTGDITVANSVYEANIGGIVGLANAGIYIGKNDPTKPTELDTYIRNSGDITAASNKVMMSGGILGRATPSASVTFSTLTSNSGNIHITGPGAAGSYAGGLVGSFEQNLELDFDFQQQGTITNYAGSSTYTGGVTGIVYGNFTWGKSFTNGVPINVSGTDGIYTGGIVGRVGGTVTFTNAAKNIASVQVTGSGNEVFTGGLVGFAGSRLLLNSTANDAYINSGSITVSGAADVYTGGIVSNKAYVKAGNNVQSSGDITVSGTQKLYTGGFVGTVSGSDMQLANESYGHKLTVSATSSGEDSAVYTGGIVGYYAVSGTIENPVFTGQMTVNGGTGAYSGGVAGYAAGGTITNATIGNPEAGPTQISSDGNVGGVTGYLSGRVTTAIVKHTSIISSGVDGFAGGIAGQAKGEISGAMVDAANFSNHENFITVNGANTSAGGVVGADDGALLISASEINTISISASAGANHARIGGAIGDNNANLSRGNLPTISTIKISSKADNAALGGIVGVNKGILTGLSANTISISSEGASSKVGGMVGFTQGEIINPRVYAEDGGVLQINVRGNDSAIGGVAGTADTTTIRGNGQDGNITGLVITTDAGASAARVGGLVGESDKASILSAVVENPQLTIGGSNSQVGGLVGLIKDAAITQSYLKGVDGEYAVLTISGNDTDAGGLAGEAERITMTGNAGDANVENLTLLVNNGTNGVRAGGIVGANIESKIEKTFAASVNLTSRGSFSLVGGITGYNKGTETAILNQNFMNVLTISLPVSASSSTVGGMIGLNDARSGNADSALIENAVSTIQNSRIVGKITVHAPNSLTGGMIGENRSIVANNSIVEKLPIVADGNQGIVGGLIGKNAGTSFYTYSNAILTIGGESTIAGGLVGENSGKILSSYIETNLIGDAVGVTGNYALLGGLVGKNSGTLDKSFTSAEVTATGSKTYVGGLVGEQTGAVSNSYSANNITAIGEGSYAGGLIGRLTMGTVTGSYSAGQVIANKLQGKDGPYAGGFAGYYNHTSKDLIDNTYYVKDESKSINSGLLDFGGGKYYELNMYSRLSPVLSESLASRTIFPSLSGWDFSDRTWRYGTPNAAYKYPELNLSANTGGTSGDGSAGSGNNVNMNINWYTKQPSALRFIIQTEADLAGLAGIVNGSITGIDRFDFKGREIEVRAPIHIQSNQWAPIGNTELNAFEGSFNGNNYVISGLKVSASSYAGLFGVIGSDATVSQINLEPITVDGNQHVGSIAGLSKGMLTHIHVKLFDLAKVSNGIIVGGIIGKNTGEATDLSLTVQGGSKLSTSANNAIVGGLVGDNSSSITNSSVTLTKGSLETTGEHAIVGGLVGRQSGNASSLTAHIQAEGTIQSTGTSSVVGGMVGSYESGRADGMTISLTGGILKAMAANAIVGGVIGQSGSDQSTSNMNLTATNETEVVNIQGNGTVGGIFGVKTGKGTNVFDVDGASVHWATLTASDSGILGGIAGKLTNAAIREVVFEGTLTASGQDIVMGGIAGHAVDSIIYEPVVSPAIHLTATEGESSVGGVAGIVESSHPDAALDFDTFIPLYAGVYEAKLNDKMIEITGSGQKANVFAGTLAGQLQSASIYNSTSSADLRVSGMKTATLGGVAGLSSGYIINTTITSGIEATSSSDYNIGGIVGQATGGKIAYVRAESPHQEQITLGDSVTITRVPTATRVGGVAGMADATDMQNVSSRLPIGVTSTNPYNTIYAGGFAGMLGENTAGLIKRVFAEGAVTVSGKAGAFTGGFAGSINAYNIQEAYASGNVSNTAFDARSGGFAGVINNGGALVDAYASQDTVTALGSNGATRSYAGGFAGYNDGSLKRVYSNVSHISALAGGANSYMGALIGYNFRDGLVASAYYTGSLPPIKHDTSSGQAANVKQADFTNHHGLQNWDFSTNAATWSYLDGINGNAPVLVNVTNWRFAPDVSFMKEQEKGDSHFIAASAEQLAGIVLLYEDLEFYKWFNRAATNWPEIEQVTLSADIALKNRLWMPLSSFEGEFDGGSHVISGLTYLADQYDNYGFISNLHGRLANVKFDQARITGGSHTGVAVGTNHTGATVSNVTVSNSNVQGLADQTGGIAGVNNGKMSQVRIAGVELTGTSAVGGIAGVNTGTVTGASAYGSITANGSFVGGITGHNLEGASIEQSFSYSDVKVRGDSPHAGGIAGENNGAITNSYNSGTVSASGTTIARAGGIAGYAPEGSIDNSINTGQVSANINGVLVKGKSWFGGIAGQVGQPTSLQHNYFDEQMLQFRSAYYDEAGNRIPTDALKAAAMKTTVLVSGDLPSGLHQSVWFAKGGFYPQLAVHNGTTESELSVAAVILNSGDTAYHVTGSYSQTIDPSIRWAIDKRGEETVLTASKTGVSRSITINKKPVLYTETAVQPTGSDTSVEFKEKMEVTLDTIELGGSIYYTLDGSEPSENSLVYTQAITLYETTTIKAITSVDGKNTSETFTGNYKKRAPITVGGGGGGGSMPPKTGSTVEVLVNGKAESIGLETSSTEGAVVTSMITVNEQVMEKLLKEQGDQAEITIVFNKRADISIGELSAELLQKMANKQANLKVDTGTVYYSIPTEQFNVKEMSTKLGTDIALKDILVRIEMRASAEEQVKQFHDAAVAGGYTLVTPPVSFKVTYTYGNRVVELGDFSSYVERAIRLSSEAETSKLSTGVVIEKDGTIHHVPTQIRHVNGNVYAVIRTLPSSGEFVLIANPVSFADATTHWAQQTINDMGSRMIVSGVGSGQYEPDREITRAEFATIIIKALGLKPDTNSSLFLDVNASDWYAPYIHTATKYGIISGYENGKFGSLDAISREQAMTIIGRAMALAGLDVTLATGEEDELLAAYVDSSLIDDYAKSGIAASLKIGLVSGRSEGRIAPDDNMTRAEVATIIQKFLKKSGLI